MTDSSGAQDVPFTISRILVPVDMRHTEASQKAIRTAVHFARGANAEVFLLTVVRPLRTQLADMPAKHKPEFEAFQLHGFDFQRLSFFKSHSGAHIHLHNSIRGILG